MLFSCFPLSQHIQVQDSPLPHPVLWQGSLPCHACRAVLHKAVGMRHGSSLKTCMTLRTTGETFLISRGTSWAEAAPLQAGQCLWGDGLPGPLQATTELHVEVSCMERWMDWLASWMLNCDNVMFTATNFQAKKQDYCGVTLWLTLHQHRHT